MAADLQTVHNTRSATDSSIGGLGVTEPEYMHSQSPVVQLESHQDTEAQSCELGQPAGLHVERKLL